MINLLRLILFSIFRSLLVLHSAVLLRKLNIFNTGVTVHKIYFLSTTKKRKKTENGTDLHQSKLPMGAY